MDTFNSVTTQKETVTLGSVTTLRQSFITASVLILTGIILAHFVDQRFLLLPLMVSGGLMFSGVMGWCPMARILQKMPWNK